MKIYEIMNDIIGVEFLECRDGWCVDGLKYGDPDAEVTKVATCLTATPDVIRAAGEWGAHLLITHEPTFGSHLDDERETELSRAKMKLLDEAGLTVYRWHDSTHFRAGDKIGESFIAHLEWKGTFNGDMDFVLDEPKTPLQIAKEISEKLGLKHPRIVGRRDGEVTRLNLSLGEPIRDLAQMGAQKTLIILGHAGSERDGMADLADNINANYSDKGISAKYFECGELYTYAD